MKKLLISLFALLLISSPIATAQGVAQNSKEFWSDSYNDIIRAYRQQRGSIIDIQFMIVQELASNTWTGESNEFSNMWNPSTTEEKRQEYIQSVIVKIFNDNFDAGLTVPQNRGQVATEKDLARKEYEKYLKDVMGLDENDSRYTSAIANWNSIPWKGSEPTIVLNGARSIRLTVGDSWVDPSATAEDSVDGTLAVVISGDTVDTNTVGNYQVTYTATDAGGQSVSVTRSVSVAPAPEPPQP